VSVVTTGNAALQLYPDGRPGPAGEIGVWAGNLNLAGDGTGGTLSMTITLLGLADVLAFTLDAVYVAVIGGTVDREFMIQIDPFVPGGTIMEWKLLADAITGLGRSTQLGRDVPSLVTVLSPTVSDPTILAQVTNPGVSETGALRTFGKLYPHQYIQRSAQVIPGIIIPK